MRCGCPAARWIILSSMRESLGWRPSFRPWWRGDSPASGAKQHAPDAAPPSRTKHRRRHGKVTDVSAGCPNLLDPDLITDLHAGFDRLRESGPVLAGLAMDGRPAWYITRLEDIRAVLADPRFVVRAESAPGRERDGVLDRMVELLGIPADLAGYLTENILTADGADHARLRNLVTRAFTARRIAALRPRIEMLAAELLDDMSGEVDLLDAFAYPLPVRVICELIGVPESDRSTWRRWNTALATLDHFSVPTVAREMIDYCHDLVRRRRADPADDLLSALAGARSDDGERLTDAEVVTMLITLVVNGHETTAQFIGNSTVTLVRHPDELRRVQDSPEL